MIDLVRVLLEGRARRLPPWQVVQLLKRRYAAAIIPLGGGAVEAVSSSITFDRWFRRSDALILSSLRHQERNLHRVLDDAMYNLQKYERDNMPGKVVFQESLLLGCMDT